MPLLQLVISYSFLAHCQSTLGAPVNITSELAAARGNVATLRNELVSGWVLSASQRGTADILWSCLVTLGACIYSAIHLNVPRANKGQAGVIRWRITWAAVAMFAPEIVLYMASSQFWAARKLRNEVNKLQQEKGSGEGKERRVLPERDLAYGFYALMGGFVTDVQDIHNEIKTATITANGVRFLAQRGYFLDISPETISAKSKAGLVGKSLIIGQVAWMALQCIVRKAHRYPLTLLEIHTMVHVVVALILYTMWWAKPQDVADPTTVPISTCPELIALMLLESNPLRKGRGVVEASYLWYYGKSSQRGTSTQSRPARTKVYPKSDVDEVTPVPPSHDTSLGEERVIVHTQPKENNIISPLSPLQAPGDGVHELVGGQSLPCGIGPCHAAPGELSSNDSALERPGIRVYLSAVDVKRWTLAATAFEQLPRRTGSFLLAGEALGYGNGILHNGILQRVANIDMVDFNFTADLGKGFILLACALLSLAYGGIHMTAWNFHFASHAEMTLWRYSCLLSLGPLPLVTVFVMMVFFFTEDISGEWDSVQKTLKVILIFLYTPICLTYVLSRLYIIVEAFVSLRYEPIGVYAAVPWVQNIPHI